MWQSTYLHARLVPFCLRATSKNYITARTYVYRMYLLRHYTKPYFCGTQQSICNCCCVYFMDCLQVYLHDDKVAGVQNEYHFHCNSDVDECEGDNLNNCHENAQCTNTVGSFTCSCNPGYTGDGVTCMST